MAGGGSEELAILITINAINRAQAGLAEVNKELQELGASADAMGAGAAGAKDDMEDLGAASTQAFGDTADAAEDATGEIDAFGDAVLGASAVAKAELGDAAVATENLQGSTADLADTADDTSSSVSSLADDVTDAADAATVAEVQTSGLEDTTSTLGDTADDTAGKVAGMGDEVATAGTAAGVAAGEHTVLKDALSGSGEATKTLTLNSLLLGKTGKKGLDSFVGGLTSIGKWGTAGVIGAAALAAHMAGDFQMAGNRLVTTAGQTRSGLAAVQAGILDMSTEVGQSASQLESGMYTVESAGFHGAEGMKVLRASAQGATEEQATMATVTTAVTSVLNAYHMSADQAVKVTNQLLTATGHGKMTFQTLASAISTVLPTANQLHIGLAQVSGAIATITAQGTSAQQAAQDVKALMDSLAKPSTTQVNMMQQLGLTPVKLQQELKTKGLTGVTDTMQQAVLNAMAKSGTEAGMVMLTAFKKSNLAMKDSQEMLANMPPALKRIATAYMDNKITASQWSTVIGHLPQKTQQMAQQFASTVQNTQAFNTLLKSGGPAVQTYVGTIEQLTGTTTAAAAMLQLTGNHTQVFQKNVDDISNSASKAGGNVQGWSHTQHLFNVEMKDAEGAVERFLILVGDKLDPYLPKIEKGFEALWREISKSGALKGIETGFTDTLKVLKPVAEIVEDITKAFLKNKDATEALGVILAGVAVGGLALYINKLTHLSQIIGGIAKTGMSLGKWAWGKISGGPTAPTGKTGAAAEQQEAGEQFQDRVAEAGEDFGGSVEEAGSTFQTTVAEAGDLFSASVEEAGEALAAILRTGGVDLQTGATTASTDLEGAGTTAAADLEGAGTTAATEIEAGATEAETSMAAGGATGGAEEGAGGAAGAGEEAAAGGGVAAGGAALGAGSILPALGAGMLGYSVGTMFTHTSAGKAMTNWLGSSILHLFTHKQTTVSAAHPTAVKTINVGRTTETLAKLEGQISLATKASSKGYREHLSGVSDALKAELPKAFLKALEALPKAATGATVTKPTMLIAGESGEEYIIPKSMLAGASLPGSVGALSPDVVSSIAGSRSTVYDIDQLIVVANNPAQMAQQLSQQARVSALSSRPNGSTNLAVAT